MKTNRTTTAQIFVENRYSKFTTFFRIPFKEASDEAFKGSYHCWRDLLGSWADVCVAALESRICVYRLFCIVGIFDLKT